MPLSRREFLKTTVAGGLAASAFPQALGAQEPARRPNILFIMTDQQPVSTIRAYGNPLIKTPNLDRLAREGTMFRNFHIAAFPCSPSRASFFTGQYAHTHGVETNDTPLSEDIPSLGNLYKAAGYQTAYIGKWHLGGNMYATDPDERWSYRRGASYQRRVDDPTGFKFAKDGPWRGGEDQPQCGFTDKWVGGWEQFRRHLREAGLGELLEKHKRLGNHNMGTSGPEGTHIHSLVPEEHHEAAFLCGEAEKFIRAQRDRSKPFCMVVSIYGPHSPVAPPQPWDSLYSAKDVPLPDNHFDKLVNKPYGQRRNVECYKLRQWTEEQFRDYIARYWGYCSYIDDRVGRLLKSLEETGELDNTVVVFTSDHGDMVGAHGMILKLGACAYDELIRVPCIVRYPRAAKSGLSSDALVESVDVLPTLLALSGLRTPDTVQGRSFEELLRGNAASAKPSGGRAASFREVVHSDWCNTGLIVRTRDWKYVSNWKQGDLDELYDMNARPLEMNNLALEPAQADRVKQMRSLIATWLAESKHPYAEPLGKAVMTGPGDTPFLEPRVTSYRQVQTTDGKAVAEFEISWKVLRPMPPETKCWCFIHVVPGSRQSVRRVPGTTAASRMGDDGITTRFVKWPPVRARALRARTGRCPVRAVEGGHGARHGRHARAHPRRHEARSSRRVDGSL